MQNKPLIVGLAHKKRPKLKSKTHENDQNVGIEQKMENANVLEFQSNIAFFVVSTKFSHVHLATICLEHAAQFGTIFQNGISCYEYFAILTTNLGPIRVLPKSLEKISVS